MNINMTSRVKSAMVLLGTLAIGLALGAMLWSTIHTRQMEKIRSLREHRTLSDIVLGVVEPVDDAQKGMVEEAVSEYQNKMSEVYREMGRRRRAESDSLGARLGRFLNPEQQKNVEHWLERNRRGSRSSSRSDSTETN